MNRTEIRRLISKSGAPVTTHRVNIAEIVFTSEIMVSAKQIYKALRVKIDSPCIASVYNNVSVLVGVGLLDAVYDPETATLLYCRKTEIGAHEKVLLEKIQKLQRRVDELEDERKDLLYEIKVLS